MRYLHLTRQFIRASLLEETAYRANFWIHLLNTLLNLATGVLAVTVLFGQTETVHGWTYAGTLAILGVYLTASALRGLFIGPSLDALAGMDGEVWSGRLDFTLLRPVDIQFLASLRKWQPFALFDLLLALGVLGFAVSQAAVGLTVERLAGFVVALFIGILVLYACLLALAAFVFWSPEVLFTWIFNGVFQLARYPVGIYPGWLRLALTWVIPVGLITTMPAETLVGAFTWGRLGLGACFALALALGASALFRYALRRYQSASS